MDYSIIARAGDVLASAEGESHINPFIVGGFGLGVLLLGLVITLLLNVNK